MALLPAHDEMHIGYVPAATLRDELTVLAVVIEALFRAPRSAVSLPRSMSPGARFTRGYDERGLPEREAQVHGIWQCPNLNKRDCPVISRSEKLHPCGRG